MNDLLSLANIVVEYLWPVLAMTLGFGLAFALFRMIGMVVGGIVPDEMKASFASAPAPKPEPQTQTKGSSHLTDVIAFVEYLRSLQRPSNCPQCGAPLEPKADVCTHCGSKV